MRLLDLASRGEFTRCVALGEARLTASDLEPTERTDLLAALCRSHLHLGAPRRALEAGQALLVLGQATPDQVGAVRHDLAYAYARLGDPFNVRQSCGAFLAERHRYTAARCLEGRVLLLLAEAEMGEHAPALLERASDWFARFGDQGGRLRVLHRLTEIALAQGDLASARQWIEQGEVLVQQNPIPDPILALHLLDRAAYYHAVGGFDLAIKLAWIALDWAEGDWAVLAQAHLSLAAIALALGEAVDGLNFALGAQAAAAAIGDEGLQQKASRLQEMVRRGYGPEPALRLAQEYDRLLEVDPS
jgi:tetratricopeptide (TPR) repeat protein